MGIPKFFRWLTRRYPLILQNVKQEEDFPPIDNLYLDLNGIVHNCIHGNDLKRHERVSNLDNFDEVWVNIMKAIDELVHSVKPKKILYLAVDGVAPRAKMNQQRARRFRSAKDAMLLKEQLEAEGKEAPNLFDSNAISPGTKFMDQLSQQLDFFVKYKLNTDPLYQNLERVVLSDGSVPGEGEHKMMDYIRQAKNQENYDPNTRHCFYGADADLIMLSLVTHEPLFIIIREEHVVKKIKQGGVQRLDLQRTNNYQLIYINLLREYLKLEYSPIAPQMMMRFDIERIIDDFVFFCFFIGNDFLPSLSSLDIGEGSLDNLIELYKKLLPEMKDYITDAGKIYWDRAEPFIRMLGQHEHEAFKKRMHSIMLAYNEKIISFDAEFGQSKTVVDKAQIIKQKIHEKLQEKKKKKIMHMTMKQSMKHVKKFLLLKKFDDDDELDESLTQKQKDIRQKMLMKYKLLRDKQRQDLNIQSDTVVQEINEESKKQETLRDVISGLKEEYFSDVQVEDIDDDDVSSVSESEIDLESIPDSTQNLEIDNKIKIQQKIVDKYAEANIQFMNEFIRTYQNDPSAAKAFYYNKKLKFDVNIPQGQHQKKVMLKRYMEGLQWVLYYYYKGAQHWRWYYPYHYAPMISDIDTNIIENYFHGSRTIDHFEPDENCSEINKPYTPLQQLLSILPPRSKHLIPEQLQSIFFGELAPFYPEDFEIDLNGRALPWEAATLIPFVNEKDVLEFEAKTLAQQNLNPEEVTRNTISFRYKSFKFDEQIKTKSRQTGKVSELKSSLSKLENLSFDYVEVTTHSEYEDVGKYSFEPKTLKGVIYPDPSFPSFTYLNVSALDTEIIVVNEVPFEKILVKVPSCQAERSNEDLILFINNFLKQQEKQLFLDFPFQKEAFPVVFENETHTFTIFGDPYNNNWKMHQDYQARDNDKYGQFCKRQEHKLIDAGFRLEEPKVFVSLNRLDSVSFDSQNNCFYKTFAEQSELVPLRILMNRRHESHYLNVDRRCSNLMESFKVNQQIVCLNQSLFGVVATTKMFDKEKDIVHLYFDKVEEENKIHDPFMGKKCLREDEEIISKTSIRRYYSDQQIETQLKLKYGVVSRLTSSFLITFTDRETYKAQVYDLGLNVKNYTKKVHIPDFVRYVDKHENLADNQVDSYTHNQHARGANHVRKHWEYSQECFDIIKEYRERFPEVIDCIVRTSRQNKGMFTLKDLYKDKDQEESQERIRTITKWLESLPISQMPYVEMGFDALHQELITKLNTHGSMIKQHYRKIQLRCKDTECFRPHMIFQEQFPYWTLPFSYSDVKDFKVGDRVMNVCSVKREYIPFGIRGTVVGKTNDKVIVLFDEQFLNGNDIYGHCQEFRGGFINPDYLINLTKKFRAIQKKNELITQSFQEEPMTEEAKANEALYAQQMIEEEAKQQQRHLKGQQYQQQNQGIQQQNQQQSYQQQRNQNYKGNNNQQMSQNSQEFKPRGQQRSQQQNYQGGQQNQNNQKPQYVIKQKSQNAQINTQVTTSQTAQSTLVQGNAEQLNQLLGFSTTTTVTSQVHVEETKQQVPLVRNESVVDDEDQDEQTSIQTPSIEEITQQAQQLLQNNPDFQQLFNMMKVAQEMQTMNIMAPTFQPNQKKPDGQQ